MTWLQELKENLSYFKGNLLILTLMHAWIILMISQAIYLIAIMPLGILTDRIGRRKVLIFSISIFILSTLLLIVTPPRTPYAIFYALTSYALLQLAVAASTSALPAFEADLIPRLKRGNVIATLMLVSGITTAIATTLGGLGYKEITPHFPFLISMALLLMGFPMIFFLMKEPSKREI